LSITLPPALPVSLLQVISAIAFCPQPPLLVPELAAGAAGELADLRAACAVAIGRVAGAGEQLILLGAGEPSRSHAAPARGSLAGYGLPVELRLGAPIDGGALELPLSLTIGDEVLIEGTGAYTTTYSAVAFNGFEPLRSYVI